MSYNNMKKLNKQTMEGDLNHKLKVLKDISGLTDYEMFVLFHKINNTNKEKWNTLKKEKYNYLDILRGEVLIKNKKLDIYNICDMFNEKGVMYRMGELDGMEVFYPNSRFGMDNFRGNLINEEEIRAMNTITYNQLWEQLDQDGFIFRATRPSIMLDHLINKGYPLDDLY